MEHPHNATVSDRKEGSKCNIKQKEEKIKLYTHCTGTGIQKRNLEETDH